MNRGFSIVELLVVVVVVSILAGMVTFGFQSTQRQSRDSKRTSDIAITQSELERFFIQNNEYPYGGGGTPAGGVTIQSFHTASLKNQNILSPDDPIASATDRYGTSPYCTRFVSPTSGCRGYFYYSFYCSTIAACTVGTANGIIGGVCKIDAVLTASASAYVLAYFDETERVYRILKSLKGSPSPSVTMTQTGTNAAIPAQTCTFSVS